MCLKKLKNKLHSYSSNKILYVQTAHVSSCIENEKGVISLIAWHGRERWELT